MLNTLLKSIKKRDFPFYFSYVNVVTLGIWKPKTKVFLFKQQHNNSKTRALDLHFLFCNMEQFLRIVEEPSSSASTEVSIDADRLKFFNSKMKTWDYAKISADDFHKLSSDYRSSILKNYYLDLSAKYSFGAGKMFVFCFWANSGLLLDCFWLIFGLLTEKIFL